MRRVTLGHVTLCIWCPASPEELIDQAIDAFADSSGKAVGNRPPRDAEAKQAPGRDAPDSPDFQPPYWADVWPSAIALGRRLVSMPLTGRRVLELGAGVGVPGLAAARCGARVVITDREPVALEVARRSAELNGLEIVTTVLDWNAPAASPDDAASKGRAPDPVALDGFDWIVGADLLYDRSHVEPLADLVARLVARGGQALIADPDRWYQGAFVVALEERGLRVIRRPTHFYWSQQARTVTLIEIARDRGDKGDAGNGRATSDSSDSRRATPDRDHSSRTRSTR